MNVLYRVLAIVAFTFFSCCCLFVWASDVTTTDSSIGLQDAINATLQHNPDLTGYEFRHKALAGERQTANLLPEFRLTTELENVAGSGEFAGADAGELTLSLSSVIELGGQRDARLALITARQRELESAQQLLTLDVLTQVTHQFIRVLAAQEQLALQRNAQHLALENLRLLTQHVQAGRTPQAELLRAKAAVARARMAQQNAQQQLASERIQLSAYWADSTPDFSTVRADLFAFSTVAPLPKLLAQLEQNPELALLANAAQVHAAELREVQTQGRTNLEWSAGVRHMRATDDSALMLGVSLPLGARNRKSGAITTATANQANAEHQRDSAKIQLTAQLISLVEAHQQTLADTHALESEVLPLLKQAMTATADAFQRGRYSYLELNLAQHELLDAQSTLITVAARAHTLGADIERLIGAPAFAPSSYSDLKDLP